MTLYTALMQTRQQQQQPAPEHKPFELSDEQAAAVDETSEPAKEAQ